ncbi:hypothetical protein AQ490_03595 [Wenjunlia vitaminophila]|uniref:Uncharacterized protein n=1 Tax=Wenjunlia vitaminophila TaxID=76728 RepID=A0A0T6LTK9_WENVI|nr:hypothetical protein [Wenjunlia vitaminophila]KRV49289.1 hypothetical protein AQ490_03595 [Wenjunlia vitaminophila]
MNIDWVALGTVFGVSVAVTVGLVGLFTVGIVALSRQEGAAATGNSVLAARTGAVACFGLCLAAVTYGIYLIVA